MFALSHHDREGSGEKEKTAAAALVALVSGDADEDVVEDEASKPSNGVMQEVCALSFEFNRVQFVGMSSLLTCVERIVIQNYYHEKQELYRQAAPPLVDSDRPEASKRVRGLEMLWSFQCDITRGRNVSAMCWNRVRQVKGSRSSF